MDLVTTYIHNSELQVIRALLLNSTHYKSPKHPLSLFPACSAFISRSLVTASNSGNPSATQVLLSQLPVQNSTQLSPERQRHLFSASLAKLNSTANPQLTGGPKFRVFSLRSPALGSPWRSCQHFPCFPVVAADFCFIRWCHCRLSSPSSDVVAP
jgi:hypothetical protein